MYCVDLGESFQVSICLQKSASIQKRTSPVKFAHLAEKSGLAVRYIEPESTKDTGADAEARCRRPADSAGSQAELSLSALQLAAAHGHAGAVAP